MLRIAVRGNGHSPHKRCEHKCRKPPILVRTLLVHLHRSIVMVMAIGTAASAATRALLLFSSLPRKFYLAAIEARQTQAEMRIAKYVRGLPSAVVERLSVTPEAVNRLRHTEKYRNDLTSETRDTP